MNRLINALFARALTPLVNGSVALLGPSLRSLNLDTASLSIVLEKVGNVFSGTANTWSAMGEYTAIEQQDIVESFHATLAAVLAEYQVTLTPAQLDAFLTAFGTRAAARYPQQAPAA